MKLDYLHGFVGVATAGTFRKAAQHLCVGQPALSRKIQALEHELGVELFERSPSGAVLTPAGRYLLSRTKAILTELEQTKRDMRVFKEGTDLQSPVTIAFGTTYALAQVLFPRVGQELKSSGGDGIQVRYYEQTTEQLHRHITSGALDIALMGNFEAAADYDVVRLVRDPLVLVSPEDSQAFRGESASISDVATLPIVTYHTDHEPRTAMDKAFKRAGLVPNIAEEAGTLATILAHIRHGAGHGVIPLSSMLAPDTSAGFCLLPIDGVFIERNVVSRHVKAESELNMVRQIVINLASEYLSSDPRFISFS